MKMKKIVALMTAAALCLGMSMTAFAAEAVNPSEGDGDAPGNNNPNPPSMTEEEYLNKYNAGQSLIAAGLHWDAEKEEWIPGIVGDVLADADLDSDELKKVEDVFKDEDKIKDILKDHYNVPKDADVTVLGVADFKYGTFNEKGEWVDLDLPKGGIDQDIYVGEAKAEGLKDGDKIYVLHYKEDGTWEVLEGTVKTVNGSAYVSVHFDSLSPVAFVKVMSSGKVVALDKKGEPIATGKSPKTGEF